MSTSSCLPLTGTSSQNSAAAMSNQSSVRSVNLLVASARPANVALLAHQALQEPQVPRESLEPQVLQDILVLTPLPRPTPRRLLALAIPVPLVPQVQWDHQDLPATLARLVPMLVPVSKDLQEHLDLLEMLELPVRQVFLALQANPVRMPHLAKGPLALRVNPARWVPQARQDSLARPESAVGQDLLVLQDLQDPKARMASLAQLAPLVFLARLAAMLSIAHALVVARSSLTTYPS